MRDTVTVSADLSSWHANLGKFTATLLFDEQLSDVKLVSSDSEEIPAHRLVRAASSDMMMRMLCKSETTGVQYVEREGREPVRIGETGATLRSLLSYAYTGRADVEVGSILAVMKAARLYLVSERGEREGDFVRAFFFIFFF